MRKIVLTLVVSLLLAGCAPAAVSTPAVTSTPSSMQSLATPTYGTVTILAGLSYKTVDLREQPDPRAPIIGHVEPGDQGKMIGIDASGTWMLVQIKKQTGWVAAQYIDYTIAQ